MFEVDQIRTTKVTSGIRLAKGATRAIDWPVVGVGFALICVVAWDLALLWLVVQLCRMMLS